MSAQRIDWWRKRLAEVEAPARTQFAEVTVAQAQPQPPPWQQAQAGQPFAVQTQNGRRVLVWPGSDAGELARLLAVMEGLAC